MITFIIKLATFSFIYSLFLGAILAIPYFIIQKFKIDKINKLIDISLFVICTILVLSQPLIISKAVEISLAFDMERVKAVWFTIGLLLCTPIAITKVKTKHTSLLIITCLIVYIIGYNTNIDNTYYILKIARILCVR
jgi:hypothetical protein